MFYRCFIKTQKQVKEKSYENDSDIYHRFGILVIVHEFGHFFFAKRSGILVREFAIGMGPKIYGHQAKDGTTYTLRLLPIGGYVRMAGNGDDETEMAPGMPLSLY